MATVLYSIDRSAMMRVLSFASIAQLAFWFVIADLFGRHMSRSVETVEVKEGEGENAGIPTKTVVVKSELAPTWQRVGIAAVSLATGCAFMGLARWYSSHYVSTILLEPGRRLHVATYSMLGKPRWLPPVSTSEVSAHLRHGGGARAAASARHWREFIIEGHRTPYKIDMQGLVREPRVLDVITGRRAN